MDEGFIFGNYVSMWDVDKNERVNINIIMCRDLSIVFIYGPCGVDNRIVVLIEVVNEDFEQHKLFYLIPRVKYYGSAMGI
jgi:hypothetical protein